VPTPFILSWLETTLSELPERKNRSANTHEH
jgi:hypothetical protein